MQTMQSCIWRGSMRTLSNVHNSIKAGIYYTFCQALFGLSVLRMTSRAAVQLS